MCPVLACACSLLIGSSRAGAKYNTINTEGGVSLLSIREKFHRIWTFIAHRGILLGIEHCPLFSHTGIICLAQVGGLQSYPAEEPILGSLQNSRKQGGLLASCHHV